MVNFQLWLERTLSSAESVPTFMRTAWGWPAAESVHFIGLTLLFGAIAAWDLRLLGMAKRVPIAAFHRLVPFAVLGFAINAASGSMFLMTEPDQYLYNPAFQFKLLFMALAGLNVVVFYLAVFRRVSGLAPGVDAPNGVKVFGAASLICWIAVIVCGRLITWYRPDMCDPSKPIGFLADCILR
jgi:hypothetical protein